MDLPHPSICLEFEALSAGIMTNLTYTPISKLHIWHTVDS